LDFSFFYINDSNLPSSGCPDYSLPVRRNTEIGPGEQRKTTCGEVIKNFLDGTAFNVENEKATFKSALVLIGRRNDRYIFR